MIYNRRDIPNYCVNKNFVNIIIEIISNKHITHSFMYNKHPIIYDIYLKYMPLNINQLCVNKKYWKPIKHCYTKNAITV